MTQEELMQRLALHAREIAEHTTRAISALDQCEGALIDTVDGFKSAGHYFRSKSPHDSHAFDRGMYRTEAALEVIRTVRESIIEKSQADLDQHYGVSANG